MRDVAHSAAPPDQTPYAVAEAVFADAKAYLSSREARQMSESELERELHRRGQELMPKLLQGHLDQRSPGKVSGPARGGRRCRALAAARARTPPGDDLRHGAGCAPSVGRARRRRPDAARPRERRRVRRRRHVVVIDIIHAAEYVWKTPRVFHRSTGVIEGVCRYMVRDRMESNGARCRLVGVEVILKPRALRASRVFDAY